MSKRLYIFQLILILLPMEYLFWYLAEGLIWLNTIMNVYTPFALGVMSFWIHAFLIFAAIWVALIVNMLLNQKRVKK